MLAKPREELVQVLEVVLKKRVAQTHVDARRSQKLGRWSATSLQAVKDYKFWFMMQIAFKARGPLDHFVHYTAKKPACDEPTAIARMVWYKKEQIAKEIEDLLDDHHAWPVWIEDLSPLATTEVLQLEYLSPQV